MGSTPWKMKGLDGPSCLGRSRTGCWGAVSSSVPACRKEWEEEFGQRGKVRVLRSMYYGAVALYLWSYQSRGYYL